jgi:hypothetical protein
MPSGKALDSSQALERLQLRDEWQPMITLRLWLYEIGWGGPYASWGIIYNTAGYQARRILYIRLESREGFGAGLHYAECTISSQRVSDIEKKASYISFPALCRDHCVVLDGNEYGVECHSGRRECPPALAGFSRCLVIAEELVLRDDHRTRHGSGGRRFRAILAHC